MPHTVEVSLWWGGDWHLLPAYDPVSTVDGYVLADTLSTRRGLADDGQPKPGEASFRIRDDQQRYDPDNEASDLYGLLGPRTPILVRVDGVGDFAGEVAGWRPGQSPDYRAAPQRGYRWTDVQAAGLWRRIAQWPKALQSPMRRFLSAQAGVHGYWPCEDAQSASRAASAVPGMPAALAPGVRFAREAGPDGSAQLCTIEGAPTWGTRLVAPAGVWQLGFVANQGAANLAAPSPLMVRVHTSTGWVVEVKGNAALGWIVYAYSPALAASEMIAVDYVVGQNDPASKRWSWFALAITPGTSSSEIRASEHTQVPPAAVPVSTYRTVTTPWNLGIPTRWYGSTYDKLAFGHVIFAGAGAPDFGTHPGVLAAFGGFRGESAADRITRLCAEEGVECLIDGDAAQAQPMGPQHPAAFDALLRECQVSDDGALTEYADYSALLYRTRRALYQAPALALLYPRDVAAPFVKVTDDLDLGNVVTVAQHDGSESTATLTTGPTGTAAIGQEHRSVTVNVADEAQLPALARYHLNMLSQPGARYPSVVIDAQAAPPAVLAAAALLEAGDLITIAGFRSQLIWLRVLSVAPVTGSHRRRLTVTTLAAPQLHVGTYGTVAASAPDRYDVAGCTVAVAVTETATSLVVQCDALNPWSRTAVPYEWDVRGEQIRVTAIGAPALVGGLYRQTATVARSVNGVRRTHPAGDAVRLWTPVFYGR